MIVYKTPKLRKPINYFIANMASSDLLFPIFFTPWILSHLHTPSFLIGGGRLGQAFCKLVAFFGEVSIKVSIQNLVIIAVDRFGAVVFPLRSPLIRSKLCPFFILATWIVAVAISSPYLFAKELFESPTETGVLQNGRKHSKSRRPVPVCYQLTSFCLRTSLCCCQPFFTPTSLSSSRHRHTQVNNRQTISNSETQETVHCYHYSVCVLLVTSLYQLFNHTVSAQFHAFLVQFLDIL